MNNETELRNDALRDADKTAPRVAVFGEWVRCDERLPEMKHDDPTPHAGRMSGALLFCTRSRRVCLGHCHSHRRGGGGVYFSGPQMCEDYSAATVTHWMPLPAPPEPNE